MSPPAAAAPSPSPIHEHGLVDLLLPGSERRAARVNAIGHGHLLLTLFGDPVGEEIGVAALELVGARGVDRVEGRVAHGGDPRTLTFEPLDPALLPQRRGAPRVEVDREVVLEYPDGASATGRTVDVSEGGLRFRCAEAFAPGQAVTVVFGPELSGAGHVIRVQGDGEYAVAFDVVSPALRARLLELVAG